MTYAIACGHQVTADAAAETLRAGGTALDAAIAAGLAAMVAEPVLAGLLGGGFLMVRDTSGRSHLLDAFVQTPSRRLPDANIALDIVTADFGTTTQDFHIGSGSIAVPGLAPSLTEAHQRFGRIPFPELAEPAIQAARNGVVLTAYQARLATIVEPILKATPAAQALHSDGDALLGEGQTLRNPDLADVLEVYSHEGPRFVQEGEIAQGLLALSKQGGQITADDLRRYEPAWRTPLEQRRGNARIHMNPPPSLGGALIAFSLQMLGHDPDSCTVAHALAATGKARLDADLLRDPVTGSTRLLSSGLVDRYRTDIARRLAATRGTTHISIIDGNGMGAALTLSNGEGCGHILPGTGIMPNNMLGEDDLLPDGLQSWTPGQRLSSMMAPITLDWPDGRFAMLGSGGSNRIRSALTQVLIHLVDRDAHLADAIEAPRLHVEPGVDEESRPTQHVDAEEPASEEDRHALLSDWPKARIWPEPSMFFGGVHVVAASGDGREAAGDPRRSGVASTA
ncbi:MAG: gamma-glutamyltransferase [Pseudomonadota bacterium]